MMSMPALSLPLQKIDTGLPAPAYAYAGDGGVDLLSVGHFELPPFKRALVPCGISLAIPAGYAGLVIPRSGLAIKHGVSLVNSPGLIDSNYRGEIKAVLVNLDPEETFFIERGDRIAQLVIIRVPEVSFKPCEGLPQTDRGEEGFGSSGVSSSL